MHFVGRIDWSFADEPGPSVDFASGLHRIRIVGPDQGAVHTDLYVGALDPGGWLAPHVHSYEECLYVLEGELLIRIDARVHRAVKGDFVLFPIGMRHGLGNSGTAQARWLSLNSPIKRDPSTAWPDTFYDAPEDLVAMDAAAVRPPFGDPTLRYVGHDASDALDSPSPVTRLVDRAFGADMVTMSTVDDQIGAAAEAHDHPFEEAYVFLAGEAECELDGERRTLHAGDVVFSGVGSVHRFRNAGTGPVRWIQTQAPQPPVRHADRWAPTWERFARRDVDGR